MPEDSSRPFHRARVVLTIGLVQIYTAWYDMTIWNGKMPILLQNVDVTGKVSGWRFYALSVHSPTCYKQC